MAYKFVSILACFLVCLDCIQKAIGNEPQSLLSTEFVWVWWFAAFGWALSAIGVMLRLQAVKA